MSGWPPVIPNTARAGTLLGVVGDVSSRRYPRGEPAPALLLTGGCSQISRDFKPRLPEVKWVR